MLQTIASTTTTTNKQLFVCFSCLLAIFYDTTSFSTFVFAFSLLMLLLLLALIFAFIVAIHIKQRRLIVFSINYYLLRERERKNNILLFCAGEKAKQKQL